MIIYIELMPNSDVIKSYSDYVRLSPNSIEVEVDENHEIRNDNPRFFRYIGGEIIRDEGLRQKRIEQINFTRNKPSTEKEIADLWYALMMGGV